MTISNNYIEEIILDIERRFNIRFKDKQRQVIEYIATLNFKRGGITVKKLRSQFNYTKDYAEKVIYELKRCGILKSSGMRNGHMLTYFLSNMQDYIPVKNMTKKNPNGNTNEYSCLDNQLIVTLLKYLTTNKGVFHNFRLQTRLRDKEDYGLLKVGRGWKLQSERNKIKVMRIVLSWSRRVRLQVSPNGTVEIYIACSNNPYDLHHDIGLSEFFADIGKIDFILEGEFGFSYPVEHFYEWHIVRVDYNYDIEKIDLSYLSSGTAILQLKHLSHIYQFYTKQLPDKGLVLRIEEHITFAKPYNTIKELFFNFAG